MAAAGDMTFAAAICMRPALPSWAVSENGTGAYHAGCSGMSTPVRHTGLPQSYVKARGAIIAQAASGFRR